MSVERAVPTDPTPLAGRVVVITGAARGLGRAYATAVAAAGATVVLNDLDDTGLDETAARVRSVGGAATTVVGDVTAHGFAEELVARAVSVSGRIDGVVNNAGVMRTGLPWAESEDDVRLQVGVNVLGAALVGRAALAAMTAQGVGVLVNITSGAQSGLPGRATYCGTKGAVSSLTYAWALDAQPYGVRVVALAPVADTEMYAESGDPTDGLLRPERVAPAVVHLLGDGAAGLSGQVVRFDGAELAVLTRPGPAATVRRADAWTAADVGAVLDGPELRGAVHSW